MTIFNPEHLFDQADKLMGPSPGGATEQADLKRAISAAYYGLFHAAMTAASDRIVGAANRSTSRYELVYRSIDHSRLREVCGQVAKRSEKFRRYVPEACFGEDIVAFADATVGLQTKRHTADYDPSFRANRSDTEIVVRQARAAFLRFQRAAVAEREAFLFLLFFRPR